mgnify:CR=1 FL=1
MTAEAEAAVVAEALIEVTVATDAVAEGTATEVATTAAVEYITTVE